jgi:Domain of unknown function (DUF4352)
MVKAADASNKPADTGYEYLLARVEFSFGPGGELIYRLNPKSFKAYSSGNKEYTSSSIVSPQPVFIGKEAYPGNTIEGWIPFVVSQKDNNPNMLYIGSDLWDENYPDISCTGSDSWFQLY